MIKQAVKEDVLTLAELAMQMWKDSTVSELTDSFADIIESENAVCFLAYCGKPIGFAQCQLRHDYVEGTQTSPVGYLEGIFIKEEFRRQGYAEELLLACEKWAKEKGCTEFASDCEINNHGSLAFHLKMGFTEANRIICFRKDIGNAASFL